VQHGQWLYFDLWRQNVPTNLKQVHCAPISTNSLNIVGTDSFTMWKQAYTGAMFSSGNLKTPFPVTASLKQDVKFKVNLTNQTLETWPGVLLKPNLLVTHLSIHQSFWTVDNHWIPSQKCLPFPNFCPSCAVSWATFSPSWSLQLSRKPLVSQISQNGLLGCLLVTDALIWNSDRCDWMLGASCKLVCNYCAGSNRPNIWPSRHRTAATCMNPVVSCFSNLKWDKEP
jgi:hypothetical protein